MATVSVTPPTFAATIAGDETDDRTAMVEPGARGVVELITTLSDTGDNTLQTSFYDSSTTHQQSMHHRSIFPLSPSAAFPQRVTSTTIKPRIAGGSVVTAQDSYPWFVHSSGGVLCGGSLIHSDLVLTAAHCATAYPSGQTVFIGATRRDVTSGTTLQRTIQDTRIHPLYNETTVHYDIMMVRLNTPVPREPVPWNRDPRIPETDDILITMGFGHTSAEEEQASIQLKQAQLQAISPINCERAYRVVANPGQEPFDFLHESMLCAGGIPDTGACQGDSGGPLITESNGVLVGLVSFGVICGSWDFPSVFTRVSGLVPWIEEQICNLSANPPLSCSTIPPSTPSEPASTGSILQIVIQYDDKPDETAWSFQHVTGERVQSGPSSPPTPWEQQVTTLEHIPAGDYVLIISDQGGDGLSQGGWVQVWLLERMKEGVTEDFTRRLLLVEGDGNFADHVTLPVRVPRTPRTVACQDQPGDFVVPLTSLNDTRSCAWLGDHMKPASSGLLSYSYMCGWWHVALFCPRTCGSCTVLRQMTCRNQNVTTTFSIDRKGYNQRNCDWLEQQPSHVREAHWCRFTHIALHCPETCDTLNCSGGRNRPDGDSFQ